MKVTFPDFIIIGAMKAGTSGFFWTLGHNHPKIDLPERKELTFFDNNWERGLEWYTSHFQHVKTRHITGEGSPSYMIRPHALRRMKKLLPKAKIIVMLRNPADRSFSQFKHYIRNSRNAQLPNCISLTENFEEFLEKYAQPPYDNRLHWMGIGMLERSIYIYQLQTLFKCYDKKQVHIIKSENYFKNPLQTINEACTFLKIKPIEHIREVENPNKSIVQLEYNADTRKKLIEYFKPYNEALYTYLGRDFNWENE